MSYPVHSRVIFQLRMQRCASCPSGFANTLFGPRLQAFALGARQCHLGRGGASKRRLARGCRRAKSEFSPVDRLCRAGADGPPGSECFRVASNAGRGCHCGCWTIRKPLGVGDGICKRTRHSSSNRRQACGLGGRIDQMGADRPGCCCGGRFDSGALHRVDCAFRKGDPASHTIERPSCVW